MASSFVEFRRSIIGFLFKDIEKFDEFMEKKPPIYMSNGWTMNEPSNRKLGLQIEEGIMGGLPNRFLYQCLYVGVNKNKRGIKYPDYLKKQKLDDDKLWLKEQVSRYYKISKRELELYWQDLIVPRLKSEKFKLSLAKKLGLDNKYRRKLGLRKIEKKTIEVGGTLWDFQ